MNRYGADVARLTISRSLERSRRGTTRLRSTLMDVAITTASPARNARTCRGVVNAGPRGLRRAPRRRRRRAPTSTGRPVSTATAATSSYSGCALTTAPSSSAVLIRTSWPSTCTVVAATLPARACRPGARAARSRTSRRRSTPATASTAVDGHERGQRVRRPALLHQDRRQPRIGRPGLEQPRRGRPATAAGRGRRRWSPARPARWSGSASAGDCVDGVAAGRPAGRSAGCPARGCRRRCRNPTMRPHGMRPPARHGRGEQRGAGRRAQLVRLVAGVHGRAGLRRAARPPPGTGTGSRPCARADHPWPSATAEAATPRHAEGVQRGSHPDDVRHRVESADLVEVHLLRGRAVRRRLGTGQPGEDVQGDAAYRLGQLGVLEQAAQVRPRTHDGAGVGAAPARRWRPDRPVPRARAPAGPARCRPRRRRPARWPAAHRRRAGRRAACRRSRPTRTGTRPGSRLLLRLLGLLRLMRRRPRLGLTGHPGREHARRRSRCRC